jgi:LytS/YehU family sensor histidine kinase
MVAGVFHLLDSSTRRREEATRSARLEAERSRLQELAAEARLDALRRELDPHFVANALNSVATCVREGGRDQALRMLEAIGELLRASFRRERDVRVTLAEELDLLELYVGIERVRVGDRMAFEIDTDPDLLGTRVPTLILQPLVENAVRHAVDRHTGHVTIRVEVRSEGEVVHIAVVDRADEPAPRRSQDDVERTGLANVRERLRLLYGDRAHLDVRLDNPGGASVEIALPLEEDAPERGRER